MGRKAIDLTGRRFGHLVVERRAATNIRGYVAWRCRCECGTVVVRSSDLLRRGSGPGTSCGCMRPAINRENAKRAAVTLRKIMPAKTRAYYQRKRYGGLYEPSAVDALDAAMRGKL
jgi:hypothetical protein